MELAIEDIMNLPESERKEKFEKMAYFYCDGVGNSITGRVYYTVAMSFVMSVVTVVATHAYTWLYNTTVGGYLKDATYFQEMVKETCDGSIGNFLLKAQRMLSASVNDGCRYYQKSAADATWMANKAAGDLITWITGIFVGPTLALDTKETLGSAELRYENTKGLIKKMFSTMDTAICKVAETIYKWVNTGTTEACTYKNMPEYKLKY